MNSILSNGEPPEILPVTSTFLEQETKEIANHNDQMATTMVVETNKTNFLGRDEFNRNKNS